MHSEEEVQNLCLQSFCKVYTTDEVPEKRQSDDGVERRNLVVEERCNMTRDYRVPQALIQCDTRNRTNTNYLFTLLKARSMYVN